MDEALFSISHSKDFPLIALALHNGHSVREEVRDILHIDEDARLREEDPFTGQWTSLGSTAVVVNRSRFELDLNRPRERAVYRKPEDAWGLRVWLKEPSEELILRSLNLYDDFYRTMFELLSKYEKRHSRFLVFDLHSYNYRRQGPEGPPDDPAKNPDINLGTNALDSGIWGNVVSEFACSLRSQRVLGRALDVRENVKFQGGQFSKWVAKNFPTSACCIAIDIKKFFMDEWTGELEAVSMRELCAALSKSASRILSVLETGA